MNNWDYILERLRGIKDRQVEMYGIMRGCLEGAKKELLGFKEYLAYLDDIKNYKDIYSNPIKWYHKEFPRASKNVEYNYHKYKEFLESHDNKYECLSLLTKSVDNAKKELDKWVEEACKQYKGLKGKIICIEDYQQHGTQWIYNEYLITDLYKRFEYYDSNKENCYINKLGYGLMASYLCGKDLIKEHWKRFEEALGYDIYEDILEDIDKYNLRIV